MMLTGVIAKRRSVVPAGNLAIMPLTYDETDRNGILTFTRQGAGPHQTPMGFEGNGYDSRLKATALPSWMSSSTAAFGLQVTYKSYGQYYADLNRYAGLGPKDTTLGVSPLVYLGADSSTLAQKCLIGIEADPGLSTCPVVHARVTTSGGTSKCHYNRPNWRYQFLTPTYQESGKTWVPNAIVFKDSTKLWSAAHLQDTLSRMWEMDPNTGSILRSFDFPSPYNHVANLAIRGNGDVWFTDSPTSDCAIVDMEASFTSGTAVIPTVMNTTSFNKIGAIDFVTISGTEYFVAAEYATSGTPYLYVFPASAIGAVTLTASSRTKRWPIGLQVQGLVMRGTQVYISFSSGGGIIRAYDLASMLSSLADGATPTAIWQEVAPSSYPEDLCVHPVTGDVWAPTEGNASVLSDRAHLSYWSSPLNGTAQENTYTVNYDGAGNFTFLMNGRDYYTVSVTPSQGAACVSIGGPPAAPAGGSTGYSYGFLKNVAIQDAPIDATLYAAIQSGSYESRTMTAIQVTLTNPGAESGTTGWTTESGTLSQIANTGSAANLIAHSGTNAFGGVNVAGYVARQRVAITGLGLSTTQLDSGNYWLKARWWQASLQESIARDTGGNGLRLLDGSLVQISENYSPQFAAQLSNAASRYPWNPRSYPQAIVANTRTVDVLMKGTRSTGSGSTQSFVDDNELWIYGP